MNIGYVCNCRSDLIKKIIISFSIICMISCLILYKLRMLYTRYPKNTINPVFYYSQMTPFWYDLKSSIFFVKSKLT